MCTAILAIHQHAKMPMIIGFNRDEIYNRPFKPPVLWEKSNSQKFLAPIDIPSDSTWAGINDAGLVVTILNYLKIKRPGKKSRGHLVRKILSTCMDIESAIEQLSNEKLTDYSPCTFILANHQKATIVKFHHVMSHDVLNSGIHVISDTDVFENDALHLQWLTHYFNQHKLDGCDPIITLKKTLSEHESSSDMELTTCCHAKLSGTTSSQIIAIDIEGKLKKFLFCPEYPCTQQYHDYSFLMNSV